jgi:hypothetical protein
MYCKSNSGTSLHGQHRRSSKDIIIDKTEGAQRTQRKLPGQYRKELRGHSGSYLVNIGRSSEDNIISTRAMLEGAQTIP